MNRILIFGATSAIAQAAARRWVARDCQLFLVGRNAEKLQSLHLDLAVRSGTAQRIHSAQADLDQLDGHEALIQQATLAMGGLDAVLVAHGSLPDQAQCEVSFDATLAALQTNAISVISLSAFVAMQLQAQGRGCLAVITSVAGNRGRQSNYVYGAAKGMASLFLQGLRNRLSPHGISVVEIQPGFVDTPMTAAFNKKGPLWASADQIGAGIVKAMDRGADIVYLPWYWRYIMLVIRSIPERVFKRMKL